MNKFEKTTLANGTVYDYLVVVEYSLTEYGHSLEVVIKTLRDWGVAHRKRKMVEG